MTAKLEKKNKTELLPISTLIYTLDFANILIASRSWSVKGLVF